MYGVVNGLFFVIEGDFSRREMSLDSVLINQYLTSVSHTPGLHSTRLENRKMVVQIITAQIMWKSKIAIDC